MSETLDVLRRSLWPFSFLWAGVISARNLAYDAGLMRSHGLDVPVVSVGNLTVGGTGKTPLVVWLVEQAIAMGRRPGVLARGYGRAEGAELNDEGMLLAERFPDLPQVQDPDRVAGGRRLVAEYDVDLVILDDGFQHRRLRRDRDLLCLDAELPLAQNRVLPAGDLREPRSGLRRADALVLTRAEGLDEEELRVRRDGLRRIAGRDLPVFYATHAPSGLRAMPGGERLPLEALAGRRVHLLSAIGRPGSFEATVKALGAELRAVTVRRDHHLHSREEVTALVAAAVEDDAVLLTTEKDAVKLRDFDLEYLVLEIEMSFLGAAPRPEEVGLE